MMINRMNESFVKTFKNVVLNEGAKLETGNTFKNAGMECEVIDHKDDYTLIYAYNKTYQPYIVAYKVDENDGSWAQGHYFDDVDDAQEYFEKVTVEKKDEYDIEEGCHRKSHKRRNVKESMFNKNKKVNKNKTFKQNGYEIRYSEDNNGYVIDNEKEDRIVGPVFKDFESAHKWFVKHKDNSGNIVERVINHKYRKRRDVKEDLGQDIDKYQEWVDYDMKRYGKISGKTMNEIKKAGLSVVKDQYGDYEVIGYNRDHH